MHIRKATHADINTMHIIRCAVKENVLRTPGLVTYADYEQMLTQDAAWVCETDSNITGFAIADIAQQNVWALFVDPEYEAKGIGSALHDVMVAHCKQLEMPMLWLSTAPTTRAEKFYRTKGWQHKGVLPSGEIRFEYDLM